MTKSALQNLLKEMELSAKPVEAGYAIFERETDEHPLFEVDLTIDEHEFYARMHQALDKAMYTSQVAWASTLPSQGFARPRAKSFF